mgnify:CR=1 FL=1|tara:strand:+ start:486 stop:695 length:210 start_codon:yes stop_codon:yes gene_type:complete
MTAPALLTVAQAAEALFGEYSSVTRKRLYSLIQSGAIKAIRHGSKHDSKRKTRYWIPLREIKALRGDDE